MAKVTLINLPGDLRQPGEGAGVLLLVLVLGGGGEKGDLRGPRAPLWWLAWRCTPTPTSRESFPSEERFSCRGAGPTFTARA